MRYLWIGLFLGLFTFAQDSSETEKKDGDTQTSKPTVMEAITVTAERAPTKVKETPARVTVINDERIAKELVRDVSDLVRYEPGVYVERDGSRLNLNGFNIRGIGGNRVRTQIDGVRTAEQFDFGPFSVHQYFVDVETLKSVEILRGAASSLYGSDALGGQVSFQTKDPSDYFNGSDRSYYKVKTGFDSKNEGRHLGGTAAFEAGNFEFLGNLVLRQHDSWENQGTIDTEDRTRTMPNTQEGDSSQFMLKAIRRVGDHSRFRLTAELFDSETDTNNFTSQGVSSRFGVTTQVSDATANDEQHRLRLSLDQVWEPQDMAFANLVTWQLHLTDSDTSQTTFETRATQVGPATQNIRRTGNVDFQQEALGLNVVLNRYWASASTTSKLSYGASLEQTKFEQFRDRRNFDLDTGNPDAYRGTLIFPTRYFPTSDMRQTAVFAEFESQLADGRLKIVPGVRYDRFELDPDTNDTIFNESTQDDIPPAALDDDAVTGKLGLQFNINEFVAISGQYAMGFRSPPFSSVNSGFTNLTGGYQTLPNPDLVPEESENLEFSFKASSSRGSAIVTYFDNTYEDFIQDTTFIGVSDRGIALFQSQNIDNTEISGFEIEGDLRVGDAFWFRGAYADIDGENTDNGDPITTIEPQKAVLGVQYSPQSNWGLSLNSTFTSSKKREDAIPASSEDDPYLPDAYQLFDLTFFWQVSDNFVLHLGAFNLSDETYWQWSAVRGRTAGDPIIDRFSSPSRSINFDIQYRW